MKRLAVLFCLVAAPALAQPMEEVIASNTIELRVQQTRTFNFSSPIKRIALSAKDVAEVIPESDRLVNMRGLAQGETLMTAYGADDRIIYQANISVLQAGGFVKIYGQGNMLGGPTKDYVGFYCDEFGCGRGDKDLAPKPFSTTVTDAKTNPDGSAVTISREYR